jgi:hypothetical protein
MKATVLSLSLLLVCFCAASCASKSMIVTDPPGAIITVSEKDFGVAEKPVGSTPCMMEGRPFATYYIKAEKAGYQPAFKTVKASELDGERAALGCCACGLPGLLGAGLVLPEEINLTLKSTETPVIPAGTPAAPPSGPQPVQMTVPQPDQRLPEGQSK